MKSLSVVILAGLMGSAAGSLAPIATSAPEDAAAIKLSGPLPAPGESAIRLVAGIVASGAREVSSPALSSLAPPAERLAVQ